MHCTLDVEWRVAPMQLAPSAATVDLPNNFFL